jgi:hypothetical protein
VVKEPEELLRIAFASGNVHPKHVDRHAQFLKFKIGAPVGNGMTPIGADDQIAIKVAFTLGRLYSYTGDSLLIENQINHFVLHVKRESRKPSGLDGKKVQEIPLRHESDELAVSGQPEEISNGRGVPIKDTSQLRHFLVGQLQEFIEQPKLMNEIQCGRMNSVTAKIAIKIGVLFQDDHIDACTGQQITRHHAGWPAAHNDASSSNLSVHHFRS